MGALLSGNANNSANDSFSYVNTNNVPSDANTNIGSRQCLNKVATTSPLGETFSFYKTCVGSASEDS